MHTIRSRLRDNQPIPAINQDFVYAVLCQIIDHGRTAEQCIKDMFQECRPLDQLCDELMDRARSELTSRSNWTSRHAPAWSRTIMIMRFKKGNPVMLQNWRTLSLKNANAKMFTNMLATRLSAIAECKTIHGSYFFEALT
jgi:hypothetical protein